MQYQLEKQEKNQVKFTFTLSAEEWESAVQKAYLANKHKYSQQGFRKGKVPRKVLENLYGKGFFYEDAFNDSFPGYYGEALDAEPGIQPVDRPDVDIVSIDENGVVFTAVATVKPEVVLGDYKGISYKRPEALVTEADVEERLEREREKLSRLVDAEDRPAKEGDSVVIDYSGTVDGVKFDGGTAEGQTLVLGSKSFIPGFEEGVAGMKLGEEKDISVKFPEDYHAEELRAKQAIFRVKVNEIKEKQLPALDDDFAKDVSEFDTLEAYRQDLRAKMTEEKKRRAEAESENELVDKIVKNAKVDIPPVMVQHEIDEMVQETEYRLMYQGLNFEDYLKYTGSSREKFREERREEAERRVKSRLVIEAIVKAEGIEASEEELTEKIKELADSAKKEIGEYRSGMQERQIDYLKNTIVMDKLFAFLKENNLAE